MRIWRVSRRIFGSSEEVHTPKRKSRKAAFEYEYDGTFKKPKSKKKSVVVKDVEPTFEEKNRPTLLGMKDELVNLVLDDNVDRSLAINVINVFGKVKKEKIGPTLGVRVHEIKMIISGGAIIRTPSFDECKRIVDNPKFKDEGLNAQFNAKLGPKIKVLGVEAIIGHEELLDEIYRGMFVRTMSKEIFLKSIKILTKPWEKLPDKTLTVIIEDTDNVIGNIKKHGKLYVKCFSFLVRDYNDVMTCFRCHSFAHRIADCVFKDRVCVRCSVEGHSSLECKNKVCCRNCQFKGYPSGQHSLSHLRRYLSEG